MAVDEHKLSASRQIVPLRDAVRAWFLISLQTFGGPAGQIAVMQHALVDTRRWIGQRRFLHAVNYCMLLPGPEAQQLAIYIGWLLNGTVGGLIAGTLFVLPGMLALLALSAIYVAYGDTTIVAMVFGGLAPAVLAIVAHSVWRIGKRALIHPALIAIAVSSFLALTLFAVPFPVVIAFAAVAGWLLRARLAARTATDDSESGGRAPLIADDALHTAPAGSRRFVTILSVGLVLWALPIAAVTVLFGQTSIFAQQGVFFSWTAVVTFGGAYAVLAYVAQQAVTSFGWLQPGEMVRGLALAETTPGPLIMVVQFVAFIAAYRNPGSLDPWVAAVIGSLLTTWVTFVPCFLFVLLGAPYVERLRHNSNLAAALTGITAAVTGVIASLAVYFAAHTLFAAPGAYRLGPLTLPDVMTISWPAAVIAVGSALMLFWGKLSVLKTLGIATCASVAITGVTLLTR